MNNNIENARKIIRLLETPTDDRRPLKNRLRKEARLKDLIEALKISKLPRTRRILCDILGARGAKSALPILIDCLDDPDWEVRSDAGEALAKINDPRAGEALLSHFLNDSLPAYAIALGAIRYRPSIPYLIDALSSPYPKVRGGAAWSLGELNVEEARGALENALELEKDSYSVARITEALKKIESR